MGAKIWVYVCLAFLLLIHNVESTNEDKSTRNAYLAVKQAEGFLLLCDWHLQMFGKEIGIEKLEESYRNKTQELKRTYREILKTENKSNFLELKGNLLRILNEMKIIFEHPEFIRSENVKDPNCLFEASVPVHSKHLVVLQQTIWNLDYPESLKETNNTCLATLWQETNAALFYHLVKDIDDVLTAVSATDIMQSIANTDVSTALNAIDIIQNIADTFENIWNGIVTNFKKLTNKIKSLLMIEATDSLSRPETIQLMKLVENILDDVVSSTAKLHPLNRKDLSTIQTAIWNLAVLQIQLYKITHYRCGVQSE